MNLTVKNIPESVYKTLKEEAARLGISLNALAVMALTAQANEIERKKKMRRSWQDLERFTSSLPPLPDSVPLIRAERRRH